MPPIYFTNAERQEIIKLFGLPIEELERDDFKSKLKKLRLKFHPDNFEHLENDAVKEMATEKFQQIESLSEKIESYLGGKPLVSNPIENSNKNDFMHPEAVFAGKRIKIEVITSDKDLKYHLFGSQYRWLEYGDSFKIPNTNASIVIDEGHLGRRIGFQESIRMYLTFSEEDSIEMIVDWLFASIEERVNTLIVAGETVPVDKDTIIAAIKKETYLRIGSTTD